MKILVLEASGLHLGFVGCYGNDWVATPNLDRLAAESVVFDQHIADCPEPVGVRPWQQRSAVTGHYAFTVTSAPASTTGLIQYEVFDNLSDFARRSLRVCARRTEQSAPLCWIDGPSLAPPWHLPADLLSVYTDEDDTDEPPLTDPARGLVNLEVADLDRLQTTYAAVVTFYDAQVGRVLDSLRAANQLDELLLCITARSGLPLGEHGMVGAERPWLHDEYVHVPLLMRLPGAAEAGLRINALTQPVDLMPTFADYLGVAWEGSHGRSLLPLVRGQAEAVRPYAVAVARVDEIEESLLRTPEQALLIPGRAAVDGPPRQPELYVKPDDRYEVNNLAPRCPEDVERLQQTLGSFIAAARQRGPLTYPPLTDEVAATLEERP